MEEEWVSLSRVARELDIAESTARRWANMFSEFLRSKGNGAGRRFDPSARDVLRRVQTLYAANYNAEQISDALRQEFTMVVDVEDESERIPSAQVFTQMGQFLGDLLETQKRMNDELSEIRGQMQAIHAENEKMRSFIDERINERDRLLMQTLRQMQEATHAQITAAQEKQKPWWKRW